MVETVEAGSPVNNKREAVIQKQLFINGQEITRIGKGQKVLNVSTSFPPKVANLRRRKIPTSHLTAWHNLCQPETILFLFVIANDYLHRGLMCSNCSQ